MLFRTLNEMTFHLADHLLTRGERITSRAGETREICDVEIFLDNPRARHLYLAGRKSNIYAAIAETLWVMAGRNEIRPYLEFFLPRAAQFSDDDETWTNGYGKKLYAHGNFDNVVHSFLLDGKNTRRAVMAIWTPGTDTIESLRDKGIMSPKDVSCFPGETKVWTSTGMKRIDDIFPGELVLSYNETTQEVEFKMVTNSGKTKDVSKLLEVELDTGDVIQATEDHLVLIKQKIGNNRLSGGFTQGRIRAEDCWVKFNELKVGDEIVRTIIKEERKGRVSFKKRLRENTNDSNWETSANLVAEYMGWDIPKGFCIHHKDGDPSNNSINNLEIILSSKHNQLHLAQNNPAKTLSCSLKREYLNELYPGITNGNYHKDWSREDVLQVVYETFREGLLPTLRASFYVENCTSLGLPTPLMLKTSNWGFDGYLDMVDQLVETFPDVSTIIKSRKLPFSKGNLGKIVSIREIGRECEVYDLTVEGNHNFVLESGWVVHNCNNFIYFWIRDNRLNMKVCVRSNDLIWGLSAINVFEWTVLQEVILGVLKAQDPATFGDVSLGYYHHSVISLHVYDATVKQAEEIVAQRDLNIPRLSPLPTWTLTPPPEYVENFFEEVYRHLTRMIESKPVPSGWLEKLFQGFHIPTDNNTLYSYIHLAKSYIQHKKGEGFTPVQLPEDLREAVRLNSFTPQEWKEHL